MTREEAIHRLAFMQQYYTWRDEDFEALEMAIEALQKPPISQRSMYQAGYRQAQEDRSSGDLISRAEAIETVGDWMVKEFGYLDLNRGERLINAIEALPSAEAPRPIDPTIEVDLESGVIPISACEPKGPKTIIYADRPRGEWIESREQNILMAKRIEKGETWRVCSNCGTGFMIGAQLEEQKCYGERFHNFCPRCGADMRGGERSE